MYKPMDQIHMIRNNGVSEQFFNLFQSVTTGFRQQEENHGNGRLRATYVA
jgi:hypothetical protein